MNYNEALKKLAKYNQEHLLEYYNELGAIEQKQLLSDIEETDFSVLENIGKTAVKRGKISPIDAVSVEDIYKNSKEYEELGLKQLKDGRIAAVLLAGGQGTRLGFKGPKGTFNIGVNRTLSIFEQQMNNIKEVADKAGRAFYLFVMTSVINHDETVKFFKDNNYFGYPQEKVRFYKQQQAPTCDYNGKVFLAEKHRIALAPNGNGGWYSSLKSGGLGEIIKRENIEWLNVYSVDNVLQKICDPAFIGATVKEGVNCSSKVVKKAFPEERVGVLCREDGKPTIIEYYEMPNDLRYEKEGEELKYRFGVILNYLFKVEKLDSALSELPYHLADKAVAHIEHGEKVTPDKPCGYKFETLVVDMVKLMGNCLAYEVEREKEFAPVKNATGVDSVETARALLIKNGIEI